MEIKKERAELRAFLKAERIRSNCEILKQITKEIQPPPPITGHLAGGVDLDRMMQIKNEIEKREASRRNGGRLEYI